VLAVLVVLVFLELPILAEEAAPSHINLLDTILELVVQV
jgi:hypothetical protein